MWKWGEKLELLSRAIGDVLQVLARIGDALRRLETEQSALRATLDALLLQQRQQGEQSAGIVALLQDAVESEEERAEREKLEKEFEEFRDAMSRLEEV